MLIELLWFSFCPAKMPRQRRIPAPPRSRRSGMSGTGLPRAGTGRCHLLGSVAWWGFRVPSPTRILFGGTRWGHTHMGFGIWGRRTPRWWYVAVSGTRTRTSVATWCRWPGTIEMGGRLFRGILILAWAMHLLGFHIFGCAPPPAQYLLASGPFVISFGGVSINKNGPHIERLLACVPLVSNDVLSSVLWTLFMLT